MSRFWQTSERHVIQAASEVGDQGCGEDQGSSSGWSILLNGADPKFGSSLRVVVDEAGVFDGLEQLAGAAIVEVCEGDEVFFNPEFRHTVAVKIADRLDTESEEPQLRLR